MDKPLNHNTEEVIRYDKFAPVFGIIGSFILFGVAGFFFTIVADQPIEEWPLIGHWFITLPVCAGLWYFFKNLILLTDSSPKVIIKPEGIVLCDYDPKTAISWDHILRANYSSTTENGSETSAYLTLTFLNEFGLPSYANARLDRLTKTSSDILRTIKQRSNLQDV